MSAAPVSLRDKVAAKRLEIFILIASCGLYFCSYFQRVGVPGTIFNAIQTDDILRGLEPALSAGAVTTLGAIYLYIYGGSQLFVGILIERFGASRVMLTGGGALALGSMAFPFMRDLPTLYAARALVATGAAVMYLCIIKMLDQFFANRHFPPLLALALIMGYAGGLTGTVPLQLATNAWGWRNALMLAGLFACVAFVAAMVMRRFGWHERAHHFAFDWRVIGRVLGNWRAYPVAFCGAINFAIYFLLQGNIGKKMLEDCCGIRPVEAAAIISGMVLLVMAGTFVGGMAPSLIGHRRKPIVMAATLLTMITVVVFLGGLEYRMPSWFFTGCYVALAVSMAAVPSVIALMKENSPPEGVAIGVGFINSSSYLMVAVLCTVAGVMLDAFGADAVITSEAVIYPIGAYRSLALVLVALAVASFCMSFFIRETRGENRYR